MGSTFSNCNQANQVGNQVEKLEALDGSEEAEDMEDVVVYDKVDLKPIYEYSCTFQSHAEFVTWLAEFKSQGILCSVSKSNKRKDDTTGRFPYRRLSYLCQCCNNKSGLIIKYNYALKQQHVMVEYSLGRKTLFKDYMYMSIIVLL